MADLISGVYSIRQIGTGRCYVGSSAKVKYRLAQHLAQLRGGKHHSAFLQRAFDKHGEAAFEFVLLEQCEIDALVAREQFYIDTLNSCFNGARFAGASPRGTVPSAETRAKLSAAGRGRKFTLEHRAKISAAHMGKKRRPDLVAALAEKLRGRKLPAERVEKMRASLVKRWAEWSPERRAEVGAKISAGQLGKKRGPAPSSANEKRAAWRASLSSEQISAMQAKKSAALKATHAKRLGRISG